MLPKTYPCWGEKCAKCPFLMHFTSKNAQDLHIMGDRKVFKNFFKFFSSSADSSDGSPIHQNDLKTFRFDLPASIAKLAFYPVCVQRPELTG